DPSQTALLSDSAPGGMARPPLKGVIEQAINSFLDTCRPQDRIVLLFVGHAISIGKESFLVPLEGELDNKDTLIPIRWLYEHLKQCPAQQKVLIMDVCRYDPGRGHERPGGGPMEAELAATLQKPPEGVQVWLACAAGQYSFEFENGF